MNNRDKLSRKYSKMKNKDNDTARIIYEDYKKITKTSKNQSKSKSKIYSVKLKLYNYNPTRALAKADTTMFARTLIINIKKNST